jgi:Stress responsive A/B Barrel Domain
MAATASRQQTGAPAGPSGHKQKEKTMIFHINLFTMKPGLSDEQRKAGLEMLHQSGAANPAVKSYVVGPELGGEFEYGAVYVFEDLDGYWAYLNHPVHVHEELEGTPNLEKFAAIDVTDSDDLEIGKKIAALQARHLQEHPDVAAVIAEAASFTVPDGTGQPSAAGGQAKA